MPHPSIILSRDGAIATVTIARAHKRNALDLPMWVALGEAMKACSADTSLRCVVIEGEGEEAFSAGADIAAFAAERGTPEREAVYGRALHESFWAIRQCLHPVVAACAGWTMGGGCGIATMSDFRLGSEATRMAIPARNLGIFYAPEEIDPILQIAGYAVVAELLIEGRVLTGREAYEKGLLSRLVPDGEVKREARALAERVAQGSPLSARFHKRMMQKLRGPLPVGEAEAREQQSFAYTEDFRNAARAFLEKRRPMFEGR
jgi:enoyl-CoA hydratase/carnithine racemase